MNGYDCGVWVLASIAAVLRGFDVTGFGEADIPWFRQFLMYNILSLPVSSES
jgi:Ulp1 family protease